MFASRITQTVPLPSDPSVTVTIRKLSWLQRQDAMRVSQQASRKEIADLGGMDEFSKLMAGVPAAPQAAPDPFLLHDVLTVLVCGVKAWTDDTPVTKEALSDLGAEDAEGLARAILALSIPAPTLEADRKNADSLSTAASPV